MVFMMMFMVMSMVMSMALSMALFMMLFMLLFMVLFMCSQIALLKLLLAAAPTSKAKTDSINILADVLPEEMP